MASTWAEMIQTLRYKGAAFEFISVDDVFERDVDEQVFPGRTGAFTEDRLMKGRRIQGQALFFDDAYPDGLTAFITAIESVGPGELVHPIFGAMQAIAQTATVKHDVEDGVDCATVQVTFIEHTDNARGPTVDVSTVAALANAVRGQAGAVTTAAAAQLDAIAGAPPETSAVLASAAGAAQSIALGASTAADDLEADGDTMSLVEIQARVNGTLSQIATAVDEIGDYADPTTYSLASSLSGLASSVQLLGARIIETKPPLETFYVTSDQSLRALAFERYGDGNRADELLSLNLIPDPLLLPRGTPLRGYAS